MKRRIFKILNLALFFIYNRIMLLFLRLDREKVLFLSESHFNLDGNLKAVFDSLGSKYEKNVYVKHDRQASEKIKDVDRLDRFKIYNSRRLLQFDFCDEAAEGAGTGSALARMRRF